MEIKFNPNTNINAAGNGGNIRKKPTGINLNDSFAHSPTLESTKGKPVFKNLASSPLQVQPELKTDQVMKNAASDPVSVSDLIRSTGTLNTAAASSTPSPFGPAISSQLQKLSDMNVKFFAKRGFRIPLFMKKFRSIDAKEAASIAKGEADPGNNTIYASMGKIAPVPVSKQKDIDVLMNYKGANQAKSQQSDLMKFLRTTDESDYKLNVRGTNYEGGYAAYKSLTGLGSDMGVSEHRVDINLYGSTLLTISQKDISNVAEIESRLKTAKIRFNSLGNNDKLFKKVNQPVGNVSIDDRTAISKGIYNQSYSSENKKIKNILSDYDFIKNNTKDDKEFVKVGKMYVEALEAKGDGYWRDYHTDILKFIINDMKDRPDDFKSFISLSKGNFHILSAMQIFKNLPKPVKQGDYQKAIASISKKSLKQVDQINEMMKPVDDSTLDDRVEIMNGLHDHAYQSDKTWKNTLKAYGLIQKFAKKPGEFAKLGKMTLRMLKANDDNYWRDSYKAGIKFIATRLKDRPEDFETFINLVKSKKNINGAIEVFKNVPASTDKSAKIDFDKASELFKNSSLNKPEQVSLIMKPIGDSTLQERLSIAEGIYKHTRGDYGEHQWKNCKKEYKRLTSLAKDGKDFVKIGKMYVEMLDSRGDSYWRSNYADGIKFITSKMKDKPEDFKTFLEMVKKIGIDSGIEIYKHIPKSSTNGTYQEAAEIFKSNSFTKTDQIEELMKPFGDTTLKERVELAEGIYKYTRGNYSEHQWKNTLKEINRLKSSCSNGREFIKVGNMFKRMLETNNDRYWRKSYKAGLNLISGEMKDSPKHFETFLKLLKNGISIDSAIKTYESLPESQKSGDFEKAAEVFKDSSLNNPEQIEFLMQPVGDSSLRERLTIAEGIYKYSRGNYSSDTWKNTVKNYKLLQSLSRNGEEFVKIGKLFTELLEAINDSYQRDYYSSLLELTASQLKDRPDDFAAMKKMLKNRVNVYGALKIYQLLPKKHTKEEFEKISDTFSHCNFTAPEQVEVLFPNIGNSTLEERIEIAQKIYGHIKGETYKDTWKNTAKDYKYIASIAKDKDDFAKLGKMYGEMLEANNDSYYRKNYRQGLDFISTTLKDKPEDFKAFIKQLKNHVGIEASIKIYQMLEKPVKPGDYEKNGKVFMRDVFRGADKVEDVMQPFANSTLEERYNIISGIYEYSKGGDYKDYWKHTMKDYGHLKELSVNKGDFVKIGKMFNRALKANNNEYWKKNHIVCLDFIAKNLKDKPADFDVFEDIVKNRISIEAAIKMYETLPQPVKDGDYKKAANTYMSYMIQWPEYIELASTPVGTVSLEDRVKILGNIKSHCRGSDSDDLFKNTKKIYNHIRSGTSGDDEFLKVAGLFTQLLESRDSDHYSKSYTKALDIILNSLKDDPKQFNAFDSFMKKTRDIERAIEAIEMISNPVTGEDYDTRTRAAELLLRGDFRKKFDLIKRNTLKGETIEDTAKLFVAVDKISRSSDKLEELEKMLRKIQRNKGSMNSSEIVNLVSEFNYDDSENLIRALNLLDKPMDDKPYKARETAFLNMAKGSRGITRESLEEAITTFETIHAGQLKGDTFSSTVLRFDKIYSFLREKKSIDLQEAKDIFITLMNEIKSGIFKNMTADQVTEKFLGILLVAKNVNDAMEQLKYYVNRAKNRTIVKGENEITIGGVRLKKRR